MLGAGSAPQNATTAKKRARIVKNSLRITMTFRGALAFRHKQKVRHLMARAYPGICTSRPAAPGPVDVELKAEHRK